LSTRRPASRQPTPTPAPADNGTNGQRNSVVLGPNDRLVGELFIEGDLRVAGKVEGTVEVTGDLEITGGGRINGAVTAYNRLSVAKAASLIGSEVRAARLAIEDGATFTGKVSMGKPAVAEAPKPVEPEPVPEPVVETAPVEVAPEKPKGRRR
jgi:cytoskeletal protein CcmA (bactofilin family)